MYHVSSQQTSQYRLISIVVLAIICFHAIADFSFDRNCCIKFSNLSFPPQGKGIGVSIGCILGMFPLFFLSDDDEKEKEAKPTAEAPSH